MSFQENRFPIILGATTATLVGALAYWGISSSGKYDTAKENYDSAVGEIKKLTRGPAYPDSANVSAKEKAVGDYKTSVEEMQKTFDKYRETKLPNVGVDVCSIALCEARAKLDAKFEASGTEMPADAHLGLGVYTRETVNAKNTGILLYQLNAFETLFGYLADAKIKKVLNIHRPQLPEEKGKKVDLKGKSYRTHPIELTFSGRESSLRDFLSAIDDSDKFAYVVRTLRIKNERETAPSAKDARFEVPKPAAEAASPFGVGGFQFPDELESAPDAADGEVVDVVVEEEAPAADVGPSDSGQILKQVLGDELIQVFVRIDVIQFLDPKPLP